MEQTKLTHLGRKPKDFQGIVNTPVCYTSTILFPDLKSYRGAEKVYKSTADDALPALSYGRYGTPSSFSLQDALSELEGGDHSIVTCSGQAAIATVLFSFLKPGDHLLIVDSVYGPTRRLCDQEIAGIGVQVEYYDPLIGAGIENLIKPNTKLIYMESPGSLSFEIQDVPSIVAAAKKHNIPTAMDNSWSTPLLFRTFDHGVDVSIHSATKYINGHSDIIMGVITTTKKHYHSIYNCFRNYGFAASPGDCFLVLRGLRSLAQRLRQQQENALKLATWLKSRKEVVKILHPAFSDCPGHEFWKRDYKGSSGLFAVILDKAYSEEALARMFDNFRLLGMGFSWGGYESLAIPFDPSTIRTATKWPHQGSSIRISVGLEDYEDIRQDIEDGLNRLAMMNN